MLVIPGDVTSPTDVARMFSTVQSAWGGLDMLCHCAGRSMRGTVLSTSMDDFRNMMETNFMSALLLAQTFGNSLAETRSESEKAFQLSFISMASAIITAIQIVSGMILVMPAFRLGVTGLVSVVIAMNVVLVLLYAIYSFGRVERSFADII